MNPKAAKHSPKSPQNTTPRTKATPAPKPIKFKAAPSQNPAISSKVRSGKSIGSKQSQLITLLRSTSGGTMEQIKKLTGWQAHTVRATISATLRKRLGLDVQSAIGAGGARVYRIAKSAAT